MSPNKTCVCKVCGSVRSFKKVTATCSRVCKDIYLARLKAEAEAAQVTTSETSPTQSAIHSGAKSHDIDPTKD